MFPHILQQLTNKMEEDQRKAITGIQRQHYQQTTQLQQQANAYRDNQIQTIQYENVGLQVEIRNVMQTTGDLIENRHFPRIGKCDSVLCVFEKIKKVKWIG